MKENESLEEANARYRAACHAMQSGVAYGGEAKDQTPKHLRVGVNSAMVTDEAMARLLIAKGVFTELEYAVTVADAMEREVARYEKELSEKFGSGVKLL